MQTLLKNTQLFRVIVEVEFRNATRTITPEDVDYLLRKTIRTNGAYTVIDPLAIEDITLEGSAKA